MAIKQGLESIFSRMARNAYLIYRLKNAPF